MSQALQGNGFPKGLIQKYTCSQPDKRTPRDQVPHESVTLPYISGLFKCICRVLAPLAILVTFRPFRTQRQELVHPRTQYQPIAGKVGCTASHVLNAPAPTLAKRVGPWTIVFVNTAGLRKIMPRNFISFTCSTLAIHLNITYHFFSPNHQL